MQWRLWRYSCWASSRSGNFQCRHACNSSTNNTAQYSTGQYTMVYGAVEEVAMQLLCRQLAWEFSVQACL